MTQYNVHFQDGKVLVLQAKSFDFELKVDPKRRIVFIFKDEKDQPLPVFLQHSKVSAVVPFRDEKGPFLTVHLASGSKLSIKAVSFSKDTSDFFRFLTDKGETVMDVFVRTEDALMISPPAKG